MRKCAGLVLAQGSSHRTVRQRSSLCVAEGGKPSYITGTELFVDGGFAQV